MRLSTYLIGIPVAVLAGVVAIANREPVTVSLDPFSLRHPDGNLSLHLPLFVALLAVLAIGLVAGWGFGAWSARRRQGRAAPKPTTGLPAPPSGPRQHP